MRNNLLLAHVVLYVVVVLAETLESGAVQLLLSRRIGHRDNQAGTLLQRLAVEVYGAMLGYEPVDVVAGRDDACARREHGSDLRNALVGD